MFHCTIMMITKNRLVIALATLFAGTCLLTACGPSKQEKDEQAETVKQENAIDTPAVELVPVVKGKLASSIAVPGELAPFLTVDLFAKINSYVKELKVDIGSQVHKGELLVKLEAPEINSQLTEAQSKIQQQKALYFASKATYDRLLSTSKTPGTVSQNDLEQAEARKRSDSANVEAAKSSYKVIAANLAYLEIRAPFDGTITVRNINLGAYVGPGGSGNQPLLVLEDHKHLRLVISVPESYTSGLNNKGDVTFTVRSLPNQKFKAQIKRLSGALDEKLRSERLEMDIDNKDNRLLPNMYADVQVPLPARDSTIILPATAVVTSTEKVFVIKVVNNHAVWVDVKKGLESKDGMGVYGDLKPGDQVIKKATDEIRDGSPIKVGAPATADDESAAKGGKKDSTAKAKK
jgi:membrane fusion protein (multidrug efflux system)